MEVRARTSGRSEDQQGVKTQDCEGREAGPGTRISGCSLRKCCVGKCCDRVQESGEASVCLRGADMQLLRRSVSPAITRMAWALWGAQE